MMSAIAALLQTAQQRLAPCTASPRLDSELLLSHVLTVSRSYLHTWPLQAVALAQQQQFYRLVQRRMLGEPIAYLIGHKEFWSLDLTLTTDVLVPRPETELLVELALKLLPATLPLRIADLGTGSGAIALALAAERPNWQIVGIDQSASALAVAQANATRCLPNATNIHFLLGNWCAHLGDNKFHAIVSNPPYLSATDPHLNNPELQFEPRSALVAGATGLEALAHIIHSAKQHLLPQGLLLLEHGYQQAAAIQASLSDADYQAIKTYVDLANQPRATLGYARGLLLCSS